MGVSPQHQLQSVVSKPSVVTWATKGRLRLDKVLAAYAATRRPSRALRIARWGSRALRVARIGAVLGRSSFAHQSSRLERPRHFRLARPTLLLGGCSSMGRAAARRLSWGLGPPHERHPPRQCWKAPRMQERRRTWPYSRGCRGRERAAMSARALPSTGNRQGVCGSGHPLIATPAAIRGTFGG
jgi:hypothetical protein